MLGFHWKGSLLTGAQDAVAAPALDQLSQPGLLQLALGKGYAASLAPSLLYPGYWLALF